MNETNTDHNGPKTTYKEDIIVNETEIFKNGEERKKKISSDKNWQKQAEPKRGHKLSYL